MKSRNEELWFTSGLSNWQPACCMEPASWFYGVHEGILPSPKPFVNDFFIIKKAANSVEKIIQNSNQIFLAIFQFVSHDA
jgi:hypothetical protein